MNKIAQGVQQFLNDEEGVTAIEYSLIAALVAVGIIGALTALKDGLVTIFGTITTALTSA
jgi:pilus assembly protein Flp/PilA